MGHTPRQRPTHLSSPAFIEYHPPPSSSISTRHSHGIDVRFDHSRFSYFLFWNLNLRRFDRDEGSFTFFQYLFVFVSVFRYPTIYFDTRWLYYLNIIESRSIVIIRFNPSFEIHRCDHRGHWHCRTVRDIEKCVVSILRWSDAQFDLRSDWSTVCSSPEATLDRVIALCSLNPSGYDEPRVMSNREGAARVDGPRWCARGGWEQVLQNFTFTNTVCVYNGLRFVLNANFGTPMATRMNGVAQNVTYLLHAIILIPFD